MSKSIKVIYGSSTGNTQRAAEAVAAGLGGSAVNITDAKAGDFNADLLVLGTSTWGYGEMQDDWQNGMKAEGTGELVHIACWNEWTEGAYLEPDTKYGYARLEAVRNVFGRRTGKPESAEEYACTR